MSRSRSTIITLALLGGGTALWVGAAVALQPDVSFHSTPNPLGIKRSPYGEVVAMAMQGPIDAYWHAAVCSDSEGCEHPGHASDHREEAGGNDSPTSFAARYQGFLDQLAADSREKTNSRASSEAHRLYLRRQIENKLRFAYELDPAHYGNYNSYHLFLTEPQIGTRPILTKQALLLASQTIDYCMREQTDPRPLLTAAAAASNILELLLQEPDRTSADDMKRHLAVVDACLARHQQLLGAAVKSGTWDLLSPLRQQETIDRYQFLTRVREAADGTIRRLEGRPAIQHAQVSD